MNEERYKAMLRGAGQVSVKHSNLCIHYSMEVFRCTTPEEADKLLYQAREHERIGNTALVITKNLFQRIHIPDSTKRPVMPLSKK